MDRDHVARARQIGEGALVPTVDAARAPTAERACRGAAGGDGDEMNRAILPEDALHTKTGHVREEQLGEHGGTSPP
jgi:hypothetical protein